MLFLARDQVPFATSTALNRIAWHAALRVRAQLGQHFKLRSPRPRTGIRINKGHKRQRPIRSEVGVLDEFMAEHITGAIRKATKARRLAVPTRFVASKRTGSGKIRAGFKPRAVLARPTGFVEGKGDRATIRRGKGRGASKGVSRMFMLRSQVSIDKRWPFRQEVARRVQSQYGPEFTLALREAVLSARRRHIKRQPRR